MQLPNSKLAELLKRRSAGRFYERYLLYFLVIEENVLN